MSGAAAPPPAAAGEAGAPTCATPQEAAPVDAADVIFGRDAASQARLREHATAVSDAVCAALADAGPCPTAEPDAIEAAIASLNPCPDEGASLDEVLGQLGPAVLSRGVLPAHARCAAHLQPPVLLAAAAAELAVGLTNQSMDSYEGSPAATLAEDHLVRWLARTLGFAQGSGVLTSGGTAGNLLGLLLARERASARVNGADANAGLPPDAARWRIVASEAAHDSIRRAARLLGLGAGAVVSVPTDAAGRIHVGALDATLAELRRAGREPIAITATAGTTDLGAIDPLTEIAARARECGAWLHVDAAVASAFALSPRLAPRLAGIELADSITADLHKLWFMPIGASALLVPDVTRLRAVHHSSDYLNRPEDEAAGMLNLVGRSLDTSRRFDALKILVGLRTTGRRRMATMVESLVELADAAAGLVAAHDELELLAPPSTVMVAFRWRPADRALDEAAIDAANTAAQRELFAGGRALVGRTRVAGRVALKLTLVNPLATADDVRALLDDVAHAARRSLHG